MKEHRPRMPNKSELASLLSLVDYNYDDEYDHWTKTGRPETGHIFNDIATLVDYIKKCEVGKDTPPPDELPVD